MTARELIEKAKEHLWDSRNPKLGHAAYCLDAALTALDAEDKERERLRADLEIVSKRYLGKCAGSPGTTKEISKAMNAAHQALSAQSKGEEG